MLLSMALQSQMEVVGIKQVKFALARVLLDQPDLLPLSKREPM